MPFGTVHCDAVGCLVPKCKFNIDPRGVRFSLIGDTLQRIDPLELQVSSAKRTCKKCHALVEKSGLTQEDGNITCVACQNRFTSVLYDERVMPVLKAGLAELYDLFLNKYKLNMISFVRLGLVQH